MRSFLARPPARLIVMPTSHLSAADVAGYIDRTLSNTARDRAEMHLSGCAACRDELAACARLAGTVRPPERRGVPWNWLGLAAAAGLVLVVARPRADRMPDEPERAAVASTRQLNAYQPANDAAVRRPDARFTWASDSAATNYRFIIIDSTGAPAWTADLADTTLSLPSAARLNVGSRYFWRVEALRADGSVSQSPQQSFTIAP